MAEGIVGKGGPPPEIAEASLPELKLTQVVKSPSPIVLPVANEAMSPDEVLIHPYGEYTIVLAKGKDKIQILDKQGKKIEGLDNTSTMILDWPLYLTGYDDYISIKKYSYAKSVLEFPEHLQKAITEFIKQTAKGPDYMQIPKSAWKVETDKIGDTTITKGDGFIIIIKQKSGMFIGFQTKNAQGIELPPRNWKKVNNINLLDKSCPQDIAQEVTSLMSAKNLSFSKQIKTGFSILVDKEKLAVVKPGQEIKDAEFTDKVSGIGNNVCEDPKENGIIYYCTSENARSIFRLDTTKDPDLWKTEVVELPNAYPQVSNLRLDPTGNFFTFESGGDFVFLVKDTLQEATRIPKLCNGVIDDEGKIRGIDKEGHLVIYGVNFQEVVQEADKRRVERLAQGLSEDFFKKELTVPPKAEVEQFQHLVPVKTDLETRFNDQLQAITSLEDLSTVFEALTRLRTRLQTEGLQPGQISFVTQGIEASIRDKEHVVAAPIVAQGLTDLNGKLSGNLTIASLSEAKSDLAKLKSLEGFVDAQVRDKIIALEKQLGTQSSELFKTQGEVIGKDINDLIAGVRSELEKMDNAFKFADWEEFALPQLVSRLGALARDCPLEAHELQQKILDARRNLQTIDREYGTKFKEKYAQVREKASETLTATAELMQVDVNSFVSRFRERGLKDRLQANSYVEGSESLKLLKQEIAELKSKNPDAAKELERSLNAQIALVMSEIERRGSATVAQTGQQMILFGQTEFPRWEGKVHEKTNRQVDIVFIPDEKTKGPGVTADKILGDIGIVDINSRGKVEKKRLYEGLQNEDALRYGSVSYKGQDVFPSYIANAEFRQIKKDYADWNRGDASNLRQELKQRRQKLTDTYAQRQGIGKREAAAEQEWKSLYKAYLKEYTDFRTKNHILLLTRIDQLRNAPETEFSNGSGYVPAWQSHWVTDEQTERYLEEMAQDAKMQLDLQEGLLNLKGHAGTGKDVLVKMFSNRTNRPYFAIDCSKWTTEFELSEDVILEAEDGASKTVKVPSVVLNAITTPGAIMYFNEINAMTEQAQIFLHGLMDEKRTLTLKTSSGKAIRAVNSVLLVGSMNPGYPGTFNPQFATKSRMTEMEIGYPPLYGEKEPNDPNTNKPVSASEALRIARGVDSLVYLTYEANPKHNEFVRRWDKYVNRIQNGAEDFTVVQKFDTDVILSLVDFGNKLREGFILKFEKARASDIKGKLLVDQPITGREMRRCAWFLSHMADAEKGAANANPEQTAKDLLERFFLSHIDKKDEREEIRKAMATWTSSKRPAA